MFCGNCGHPAQKGDKYCASCGTALASRAVPAAASPFGSKAAKRQEPRKPLSRRAQIILASAAGVLLLAGASYGIAHFTYGPSTPQKLLVKASKAVKAGDANALSALLDPDQSELRTAGALAAFQKTLGESDVKDYYLDELEDAAEAAKSKISLFGGLIDGAGDISFDKQKSWRGTRWYFTVQPAELSFVGQEGLQVEGQLDVGDVKPVDGAFKGLWPSIYGYTAVVSNHYAKEEVKGSANLLIRLNREINPAYDMKTSLNLRMPEEEGVTVTLNGKELPSDNGYVRLSPAPEKAAFMVKATVLGTDFQESLEVNTKEKPDVDLNGLLNGQMAEIALETAYQGALSWTEAFNRGNPSLLKAADPASSYSKNAAGDISQPAENAIHLVKVLVDPDSIEWDGDTLQISVREMYRFDNPPDSWFGTQEVTKDYSYTMKKAGDGTGWWLDSYSSTWFDDSHAISKDQAGTST
ncbi:zinc ribbon domain-containing protein [Gorillibacterium timonense]|uniref:zinc ribbon domain-containing protein n=1 Tax=Gorillibacterium timonense TaxID=1689269 RepID=UPI00071E05E0|nr:zinc ribbon domain-containing protein [Gorillibacterium timonense]